MATTMSDAAIPGPVAPIVVGQPGTGIFICPACDAAVELDYEAQFVRCNCGCVFDFVRCPKCDAAQPFVSEAPYKSRRKLPIDCRQCNRLLGSWKGVQLTSFLALIGNDPSAESGWWQASDGKWYAPELHPDADSEQLLKDRAREHLDKSLGKLKKIARDTTTPTHSLALLARHGDPSIRVCVAANPNTDPFQLRLLAVDGDRLVRSWATMSAQRRGIGTGSSASAESASARLGPLAVLDGAGWAPQIGSQALLDVYPDRIELASSGASSAVPLNSLRDIQVGGRSVTTGGGFFGGGFGAKGAVEGMLISTALNSLSRKKAKWVTIRIVADGGWVDLRLDNYDVLPVRSTLRVLADQVIQTRPLISVLL